MLEWLSNILIRNTQENILRYIKNNNEMYQNIKDSNIRKLN